MEDAAEEDQEEERDREAGRGDPQLARLALHPEQPGRERQPHQHEQRQERVRIRAPVDQPGLHEQPREAVADDPVRLAAVLDRVGPEGAGIPDDEREDPRRRDRREHARPRAATSRRGSRCRTATARNGRATNANCFISTATPSAAAAQSSRRRATSANASTVKSTPGASAVPNHAACTASGLGSDDRSEHEPPDERPGEEQRRRRIPASIVRSTKKR